jgi:vancomycin resistance protein YoaR
VRRLRALGSAATVAAAAIALGLLYAGSPDRIAEGITIDGVDVGGLTAKAARTKLERRADRLAAVPVVFRAGGKRFQIRPRDLGVELDWAAGVDRAIAKGQGFSLVRGYRRLGLRLSPDDVQPEVRTYHSAVEYKISLLAAAIDRRPAEARLVRHGLRFQTVPGRPGQELDRDRAEAVVVAALARNAHGAVELPVETAEPKVTAGDLARVRAAANRVVSAPITLRVGELRLPVERTELARMLELPEDGGGLAIGGPAANRFFHRLDRAVTKPARNARFTVDGSGHIGIEPSATGLTLDVPRTATAMLAAAKRTHARTASAVVATVNPERTTAEARRMGITGLVGSYETFYGGVANRIHNVQLVAHLIDGKLIAPGATFSFNDATGERSADKGFLEAPVIINGELENGLGGGVCQVSTTVFNAAYEAGLPIVSRTNHALYISHYPLGRDATVDYPNIDLKFQNDTGRWLLLRTFVGSSSLVVNLYGAPQDRRVETETAPLRVLSPPPLERSVDKSLAPGAVVVESYGVPAQATSVHRRVFTSAGKLLYDSTWYSTYRAEPKIVLVGPKAPPKKKEAPAATTTTPDETTTTGTATSETATSETATSETTTSETTTSETTTTTATTTAATTTAATTAPEPPR